jgi:6-phosphogluconolactonase
MSARLFFLCLFCFNAAFAQTNAFLLIGTYTSGKSEGIYVYDFDTQTGASKKRSSVQTPNPSYLAVSPYQKIVYAVAETDEAKKEGTGGAVSAFSFNPANGSLSLINQQFSQGRNPCYVSVDKTGKWVFAGNYSSGSAVLFPVRADGGLETAKQVLQHTGTGPNKDRQEAPHVHSTVLSPDNKFLFTPDLGTDKVMIYRFDKKNGTLSPAPTPFAESVPGSGPRHFDFHPNKKYAYLVEEMSGTVVAFKYKKGKLAPIQRTSILPTGFKGVIGSADIHVSPDGRFLYASNRGESNTIAIFSIDAKTGKLTAIGHQSTIGKTPRNFNFDPGGNFLLVANQSTDDIVIFKIDKATGLLTDTGKRINVPNPVCIKWIQ